MGYSKLTTSKKPLRKSKKETVEKREFIPRIICKYWLEGACQKGEDCTFSHAKLPQKKSEICKFFLTNTCLKGDACIFSHDTSKVPCRFFHTKHYCLEGDQCRFSHEPISSEEIRALIEQETSYLEKLGRVGGRLHSKDESSSIPSHAENGSQKITESPPNWEQSDTKNLKTRLEWEEASTVFPPFMDPFKSPFL